MLEDAQIQFDIPDDLIGGTYANQVVVWHTYHEFTLDFSVAPTVPTGVIDESGNMVIPSRVVARIKVPHSVIFEIARVISANVDEYEQAFRAITPQPGDS